MTGAAERSKKINLTSLRNAFKEGAIPNEQDYGDLIDLAAVGGRVLGATDEDATTPHLVEGLMYADGKLAILSAPAGGISVSGDGVSVKVDGNTLAVTEKGIALKLQQDGGLAISDNGLHIKVGTGLKSDKDGVAIALGPKSGLTDEGNKLAINLSQASGLAFDDSGALKVNVNTDEKNNYITLTDKGLAITSEGVEKIKEGLKEASLTALKRAVAGTDSGAKGEHDLNGEVEKQIAQALIAAYQKRRDEERVALPAIDVLPQLTEKINLKEELKKHHPGILEGIELYACLQGDNDKELWGSIVTELTADGILRFTQKVGGDIHIVGVGISHDQKGQFPIMVEWSFKVAVPALSDKSTINLDKISYLTGTDMTVSVVLKDKDNNPVTGLKAIMSNSVTVPDSNPKGNEEGLWKEPEPGHYSCVYVANTYGPSANADRYKASLNLLGWSDKKESDEYHIFAAPAVSKVTIKGEARPGQRLRAEYDFVSNGTGADESSVKWQWRNDTEWKEFATASKLDGNDYIPGSDDVGELVRACVTPKGKEQSIEGAGVWVAESDLVTISYLKSAPLKEVSVNGHVFAHDAGFPTTGFIGAKFTLVLDGGNPSDYTWSASATWVKVVDGVVTFESKGDGKEVTISWKLKNGSSDSLEYKFSLKKWFTKNE